MAIGATFGTKIDDADAARRTQLKTLWAVVDADGNLVRGKGVTLARKNNTSVPGTYQVFFDRDVTTAPTSPLPSMASLAIPASTKTSLIP